MNMDDVGELVVQRTRRAPRTPETGRLIAPVVTERDGTSRLYRFALMGPGGDWVAYSDAPDSLCAAVLEMPLSDYRALDQQSRLTERLRYCARALVPIQALAAAQCGPQSESLSEELRLVLFAGPFDRQYQMPDIWQGLPPLVLLSTDLRCGLGGPDAPPKPICALCGDVARCPHVIVLDPETDWSMVESLAECGWIGLAEAVQVALN